MDNIFLFDPANSRFLTPEYLKHPLISKTPEIMRTEQSVFYRGRYFITVILLAALVGVTLLLLAFITRIAESSSIYSPGSPLANIGVIGLLVLWIVMAVMLLGGILRRFTQVYDPTHSITLKDEGVVVLGEMQAIDWIKHRNAYWLTVRAHYPGVPDTTLYTVFPTANNSEIQTRPEPGTTIALLYSGVWGTPFYKVEVL